MFTLIVAGLISSALVFILVFILGNLGVGFESMMFVNTLGSIIWGLIVGYKMNTLIRAYK